MTGAELIAAERERQVQGEGWTPAHDDQHMYGEMVMAAICYADPERTGEPDINWPWSAEWWKPSIVDEVRDLVKAGALIAAEIDRLQRERARHA